MSCPYAEGNISGWALRWTVRSRCSARANSKRGAGGEEAKAVVSVEQSTETAWHDSVLGIVQTANGASRTQTSGPSLVSRFGVSCDSVLSKGHNRSIWHAAMRHVGRHINWG